MNLRYLRYFIAIAEAKSITQAAERLHTVQPSLSRQIKRLEAIVGTPLFFHAKHEVRLTPAGEIFLQHCRAILQSVDDAITHARECARVQGNRITIGHMQGTGTWLTNTLLPKVHEKYPQLQIAFRSFNEIEMLTGLQDHSIDIAFMKGPITNPNLTSDLILSEHVFAVLPASHPLAKLKSIPLDKLAELPLLRPPIATSPRIVEFLDSIGRNAGVAFKSAATDCENVLTCMHAVGMGLGFAFLSETVVRVAPKDVAVRRLAINPQPIFDLLAVYRKDDTSMALATLLSIVKENKLSRPLHV